MRDKEIINGIHNYCDRWCEHCAFTQQCSVYDEASQLTGENKDNTNEQFWQNIESNFKKAVEMLHTMAAKYGIDLEATPPPQQQRLSKKAAIASNKALEAITVDYIKQVNLWFERNHAFFYDHEETLNRQLAMDIKIDQEEVNHLIDAIEIIRWYQMFIAAKVHRSISGLGWLDEEMDPVQNDANGSAKIALIGIERSLSAWESMRTYFPEKTDELIDIFLLLGRIQKEVKTRFPKAYEFVRPGFDELLVR